MRRPSRVVYASALLAIAFSGLLVAWFVSGWADVRAQQRDIRQAPAREAQLHAAELSQEMRAELARLLTRELERPYYHYSNLFHDPRAGASWSVTPSPLASGPDDPLVLGYFQIDTIGRVTTPTINDDVPELSEPKHLAQNQRFRDDVTRSLADELRTRPKDKDATIVAQADDQRKQRAQQVQAQAQVMQIDPSSYAQNAASNEVYIQQQSVQQTSTLSKTGAPIAITVSPLEWWTRPFAASPALIAVRHVDTPDGRLVQGFVVDKSALTSSLAARAGAYQAELRAVDDPTAPEVVPGWHVHVSPNPRMIGDASRDAAAVVRRFLTRFVLVGLLAAALFGFVLLLVARAEKLARERSQFAAAAAHELRTPLAGLQLYGDMLADGLGDPGKLRDYARRMSEEASRLGRVVSNVLGFSQLERGNLSVEVRPGELGTALCELAERAQPALDRAGAVLALDVPPDLRARFDRDALARIVGNLLDNAEKYSRTADDRTIELTARAAGDRVEVIVHDHGPGIAQPTALFQPFKRGVTSDGPAGLGLGLALSRSLAQAMGGELDYRPAERGATFVLTLAGA
ncbi:MAG TPA: HAMP domain-containing sensor histidine kinase [Kofleriaceae bacterium]|nr:HAMP domain-containing sensor histidine kinase [Kofleriaceae bacterium]